MSSDIDIPGTQSTPAIQAVWSGGHLAMQGDSYPENSYEFFDDIIGWVQRYLEEEEAPLKLDLELAYLNTSSVKAMMDIFDMLEEAHEQGRKVEVVWQYDAENERIAEVAEEFREDCSYPFAITPKTGDS